MIKITIRLMICFVALLLFFAQRTDARQQIHLSLFPGYQVINTDEVSADPRAGKTNWIFGGNLAVQSSVRDIPYEFRISYSQGNSTVYETQFVTGIQENYSVNLLYSTVPVEILLVQNITDRFKLSAGINAVAQHRTLIYNDLNIQNDRLLSFGAGLSGKASLVLSEFEDGNGFVFVSISARWTEFMFHNSKNRNTDDYTYRHVLISPQLGVAFNFN